MKPPLLKSDLIYPELSYDIVGCAYTVYDELGPGHMEKVYQKAMSIVLKERGIAFAEQIQFPVKFRNEIIG